MKLEEAGKLLAAIIICQLAGAIGSIFTISNIPTWYAGLTKPWFSPPNWVFAPVWITLYALMGVSAYMIWKRGIARREVRLALGVFAVQLLLNTIWSIAFFGLKSPFYGLLVIIPLWASIAVTILWFQRISGQAGLLQVPYLCWVTFAGILNLFVWILNP